MSSKSNYIKDAILNVLRATNITAPATIYASLHTTATTDAGGGTEVSGNAYARKAAAFSAPTTSGGARQVVNSGAVLFDVATPSGWGTVTHFALWDALTVGNMLYHGPLLYPAATYKAFSADTGDTLTSPAHGYANGDYVYVFGDALPTGLSEGTKYFVINSATDSFKLSLTSGGTAVDITVAGTGTVVKALEKTIGVNDQLNIPIGSLVVQER